jgi:hypothetical protein
MRREQVKPAITTSGRGLRVITASWSNKGGVQNHSGKETRSVHMAHSNQTRAFLDNLHSNHDGSRVRLSS